MKPRLMHLTDIPEGKKLRGILWKASVPDTYENRKLTRKNKLLHIISAKTKENIELNFPARLPASLYHVFFDATTDQLRPNLISTQIQIQRNSGNEFLVQCDEMPVSSGLLGWIRNLFRLNNATNGLTFMQRLWLRSIIASLAESIKLLKKLRIKLKNPLDLNKHLFDDIVQLEKIHANLNKFIKH